MLRNMRFNHSTVTPGSASRLSITSLPLRLTAIVRSALTAEIGAIGTGSKIPPSASRRPPTSYGVITPGIAMDARMASSSGPC